MSANRVLGVLAGFSGVILMIGPSALTAQPSISGRNARCWGGDFLFVCRDFRAAVQGDGRFAARDRDRSGHGLGDLLAPIAAFIDMPWRLAFPAPDVWLSVAGIALLSTALAYILYSAFSRAQGRRISHSSPPHPGQRHPARRAFPRRSGLCPAISAASPSSPSASRIDGRPVKTWQWLGGRRNDRRRSKAGYLKVNPSRQPDRPSGGVDDDGAEMSFMMMKLRRPCRGGRSGRGKGCLLRPAPRPVRSLKMRRLRLLAVFHSTSPGRWLCENFSYASGR